MALKLISVAFIGLFVISVALTAITFKKARALKPSSLMLTAAISLATMAVYLALLGAAANLLVGAGAFALGAVAGLAWGGATMVRREQGRVVSQGTTLSLLLWAATLVVSQAANLVAGGAPAPPIYLLALSTALTVTYNAVLAGRGLRAAEGAR